MWEKLYVMYNKTKFITCVNQVIDFYESTVVMSSYYNALYDVETW